MRPAHVRRRAHEASRSYKDPAMPACCWLVNWQEDHLGADAFFYCSVLARLMDLAVG